MSKPKTVEFTAEEVLEALSMQEMADQLGVTYANMSGRAETEMFQNYVREVSTKPRHRTWHRGDFKAYVRALKKIDQMRRNEG